MKVAIFTLAAAFLVCLFGPMLGHALGLGQFAALSVGFVPGMLLLFPTMKRYFSPKLQFTTWCTLILIICAFAFGIHKLLP